MSIKRTARRKRVAALRKGKSLGVKRKVRMKGKTKRMIVKRQLKKKTRLVNKGRSALRLIRSGGYNRGFDNGYDTGYTDGFNKGFEDGFEHMYSAS